jgi:signal transduction histidine kinase
LQEVFINLIQNAMDAMDGVEDTRRVLTVRTRAADANLVVAEVEDSGPGIDAKDVERVFDAFVTTKATGMG